VEAIVLLLKSRNSSTDYKQKLTASFSSDRWTGRGWITFVSINRNGNSPPSITAVTLGVRVLIITLDTHTDTDTRCCHTLCTRTDNHSRYTHRHRHTRCCHTLCTRTDNHSRYTYRDTQRHNT